MGGGRGKRFWVGGVKGQDRGVTPCIRSRTTFSILSPSYIQFFGTLFIS